jgi:hypothetical protein
MKRRKNPPTGRLGCFHFGLLETGRQLPAIPQPEGWGYFIPAYNAGKKRVANGPRRFVAANVNPSLPFGRLRKESEPVGNVGSRERSPTFRLGDCGEPPPRFQ